MCVYVRSCVGIVVHTFRGQKTALGSSPFPPWGGRVCLVSARLVLQAYCPMNFWMFLLVLFPSSP